MMLFYFDSRTVYAEELIFLHLLNVALRLFQTAGYSRHAVTVR